MSRSFRKNVVRALCTLIMLVIGVIMIMPLLWMISASLKTAGEVFDYPIRWIPRRIMWSNYADVWNNRFYPFYRMYLNSAVVTVTSILLMLLVSSLAAYAYAKMEFRGKNVLFICLLGTMMIPNQLLLVPRFILYNFFGLYNTLSALIFSNLVNVLAVFLLRQFYVTIPDELSEAAKIDGASHFTIWARIILPLAKPAFLSLIILSFVWFWNDYENPLIFIRSKALYTIPIGLKVYTDDNTAAYQLIMAGSTLAIMPVLLVFLFFQRYFIEGLAKSSIKG